MDNPFILVAFLYPLQYKIQIFYPYKQFHTFPDDLHEALKLPTLKKVNKFITLYFYPRLIVVGKNTKVPARKWAKVQVTWGVRPGWSLQMALRSLNQSREKKLQAPSRWSQRRSRASCSALFPLAQAKRPFDGAILWWASSPWGMRPQWERLIPRPQKY